MARNTRTFKDIDLNFTAHPVTGDVARKYDEAAIKQSVRNLILTQNYERPFHSEIGSQVRSALFESASPMTAAILQRSIEDVINNFEPRAVLLEVEVIDNLDNNAYNVKIVFKIINTETPISVNLILKRTR
jgi:phage baseplate assembly protein W